jgi:hypothetical protein
MLSRIVRFSFMESINRMLVTPELPAYAFGIGTYL